MIQTTVRLESIEYDYLKAKEIGINKYLRKLVNADMGKRVTVLTHEKPEAIKPLSMPPVVKSDKITVAKKKLEEVAKEKPDWKKNLQKRKSNEIDEDTF